MAVQPVSYTHLLLLERLQNGAAPRAVVSIDNGSHNGEKLQASVMTVAKAWLEKGYVGQDFIDYQMCIRDSLQDAQFCKWILG